MLVWSSLFIKFKNKNGDPQDTIKPDQIATYEENGKSCAKIVDVKTGYEDNRIDMFQFDNYRLMRDNADVFSEKLAGATRNTTQIEYLFLPGGTGQSAKTAAENAEKAIIKHLNANTLPPHVVIKFLNDQGVLETL